MYVIAVSWKPTPVDELARTFAAALGKTAYEMRARASAPNGGPTIVATFGSLELAKPVADVLCAAGLDVLVDTPDSIRNGWTVVMGRRIELGDTVVIEDRAGAKYAIPGDEVQVVLSGVGHWTESETQVQSGRKFSAGRALMTGGLMMSKKTVTKQVTITKGGDRYLAVYTATQCFLLSETELQYAGLGERLQPSRAANFMVVQRDLAARFSGAIHDARLLSRAGQAQTLGPAFPPEEHGDLAGALLARFLTRRI